MTRSVGQQAFRVVELGTEPGLALCGKWLGALGGAVTRIDQPGQPMDRRPRAAAGASSENALDLYLNTGKERRTLDLDAVKDRATLAGLLAEADVFITSLDPVRLADLKLDAGSLGSHALTMGRISPLGDRGSYAGLKGQDLQALALSGLLYIVGEPDRAPLPLPGVQASYSAGLALLSGVMVCVWAADRKREFREIVTSGVRACAYLDWKSQIYFEAEGKVLVRGSDRGPIVVRCADGYLGFYYRPGDWENVKQVIGGTALNDERFATQAARDKNRAALRQAMEQELAGRRKAQVYAASQAANIPVGEVLSLGEALEDKQYDARGFWQNTDIAGRVCRMPAMPWTVNGTRQSLNSDEPAAIAGAAQ
jgi:crotonobetainyl-CoA:carnitine CoA-transferase CaiB-like acyl-CoA transferase